MYFQSALQIAEERKAEMIRDQKAHSHPIYPVRENTANKTCHACTDIAEGVAEPGC